MCTYRIVLCAVALRAFLNESWARSFVHGVKFHEYVTLTPTFNIFPVYKKLNFTLSSTDNYLGDPPQGFHRNSFQFTLGVTYVLR